MNTTGAEGLVISRVTKSFASRTRRVAALGEVSLAVARGQFVTVIGPSGCGKSTLLRLVAGLLTQDEGEISIFGESVERARSSKHIGFVPQSPALLAWRTVLGNVELPLRVNRRVNAAGTRSPEEILRAFGLGEVMDQHPSELSGGMQQRVAIARAFALAPSVLLMDEPFSALDELTREVLRHELLTLFERDKTTVLFVTHSILEAVLLADVVVVMSGQPGQIRCAIPIDLPRPRAEGIEYSDEFRELELTVRSELRAGWSRARV